MFGCPPLSNAGSEPWTGQVELCSSPDASATTFSRSAAPRPRPNRSPVDTSSTSRRRSFTSRARRRSRWAISLPRCGQVGRAAHERPKSDGSCAGLSAGGRARNVIVAADVPRKQKLWPRALAGAATLVLLLGTLATMSVNLERDTTRSADLAVRTSVSSISEAQPLATRSLRRPSRRRSRRRASSICRSLHRCRRRPRRARARRWSRPLRYLWTHH